MPFAVILVALTMGTTTHAQVQKQSDWEAQFAGLSGVSISCIRTIKKNYASRVCDALKSHAAKRLSAADIPNVNGETVFSKSKDTPQIPPSSIAEGLNLTIYVRATDPGPLGMDVRVNASVSFEGAVEASATTGLDQAAGRRGELLLWQTGVTSAATGGTRKLERAVIGAVKKRMNGILDALEENWAR